MIRGAGCQTKRPNPIYSLGQGSRLHFVALRCWWSQFIVPEVLIVDVVGDIFQILHVCSVGKFNYNIDKQKQNKRYSLTLTQNIFFFKHAHCVYDANTISRIRIHLSIFFKILKKWFLKTCLEQSLFLFHKRYTTIYWTNIENMELWPDDHIPECDEVVVFQVFHLHNAPGILPASHSLASHLDDTVAAYHCKRNSVLCTEDS